MDPLSIAAATIGTADVAFRLGRFIKRTIQGAKTVDNELRELLSQVENLRVVSTGIASITQAHDFDQTLRRSFTDANSQEWEQLWRETGRISKEAGRILEHLESVLKDIHRVNSDLSEDDSEVEALPNTARRSGASSALKLNVKILKMQLRKESRAKEIGEIRQQIDTSQTALSTCLAMINLGWNVRSHKSISDSLNESREQFTRLLNVLLEKINSLQKAAPPDSELSNRLFIAPQASKEFTGRAWLFNQIEEAFGLTSYTSADHEGFVMSPHGSLSESRTLTGKESNENPAFPSTSKCKPDDGIFHGGQKQKRFVLQGVPGSGKTEMCRKFAEQNQSRFWGIFWIDATSDETAQSSYKDIADIAGVGDGNVKTVLAYLAGLVHPWLLVIDNADDENMSVEKYFPGGYRGHILVTTRQPALRSLGNVGAGSCQLGQLDEMEAQDLLLKHAQEERPWDEFAQTTAKRIVKILGYLPLALVHAGKAIAEGITTLADCTRWFNDSWDRVRLQSKLSGRVVDDARKHVFAPFEALLQNLSFEHTQSAQDAVELLKMFSFLHHENITFEFLSKAASYPPKVEAESRDRHDIEQAEKMAKKGKELVVKQQPWRQRFRERLIQAVMWYEERTVSPVLPVALRHNPGATDILKEFSKDRLRLALTRLTQKSLITERSKKGIKAYSMHPLIHQWVRERPQMSIAERGLWCQAAITTLNQCIDLPPLGDKEADFRRQLLPHLDAAMKSQDEIERSLVKNRNMRSLSSFLLLRTPTIGRAKAQQFARFSRVYTESGRFQDAAILQEKVRDYVIEVLGAEDEKTVLITMALSATYWSMSRINDAALLQNQALHTCLNVLGGDHHRTLKVMDYLGKTECFRGRFKEARKLHEDALAGMEKILPSDHEDIFYVLDNLGIVWHRYFQYEKSIDFHNQALKGLTKALGADHDETLKIKENLAIAYLEMSLDYGVEIRLSKDVTTADSLRKAYELESDVLETRRKKMGKENNWTLWARFNFARIKASLGWLEEAEADMWAALETGINNLCETHFAILYGKAHLARVIVAQKRYDEAEAMFEDVTEKSKFDSGLRSEGESPDHLLAVWYYSGCCHLNEKPQKAMDLLEGIYVGLTRIGAEKHPFWQRVIKKLEELRIEVEEIHLKGENVTLVRGGDEANQKQELELAT